MDVHHHFLFETTSILHLHQSTAIQRSFQLPPPASGHLKCPDRPDVTCQGHSTAPLIRQVLSFWRSNEGFHRCADSIISKHDGGDMFH